MNLFFNNGRSIQHVYFTRTPTKKWQFLGSSPCSRLFRDLTSLETQVNIPVVGNRLIVTPLKTDPFKKTWSDNSVLQCRFPNHSLWNSTPAHSWTSKPWETHRWAFHPGRFWSSSWHHGRPAVLQCASARENNHCCVHISQTSNPNLVWMCVNTCMCVYNYWCGCV